MGGRKGLLARETTGAPVLLRAFFKGSKVKKHRPAAIADMTKPDRRAFRRHSAKVKKEPNGKYDYFKCDVQWVGGLFCEAHL